jgi:hypothetical protein
MSFVTGLVRKGAGLPSPVAVRPSFGPQNLPGPIATTPSTNSLPANAPEALPASDNPRLAARSTKIEQPAAVFRPRGVFSGTNRVEESSTENETPASIPQVRQSVTPQPHAAPSATSDVPHRKPRSIESDIKPSPILSPEAPSTNSKATPRQASRSATTSIEALEAKLRGQRSRAGEDDSKSARLPAKVVPRLESGIAVPTAKPSASVPQQAKEAGETRSIQVKIGRVEIRSTQPSAPVRTARKPATAGFADLTIARSYLDRSGW